MKIIGAMFIVASFFVFGMLKRAAKLKEENALKCLIEMLNELRDNIEYKSNSLKDVFVRLTVNDKYESLDFLPMLLAKLDEGKNLKESLVSSFLASDLATKLSKSDSMEICELFESLGTNTEGVVVQKIEYTLLRLEDSKKAKAEINKKQKGYYEALFTLAGAAVAIALL